LQDVQKQDNRQGVAMYNLLKSKSVLYVEDEAEVLRNISELLGNFFDNFYTAMDGVEAWDIFRTHTIDVALIDIELPRLNGLELIRRIRAVDKEIPIVVISAYTKTDYLLESVELRLDKYIIKPLTSKKIHQLLDKLNEDFSNENILELAPEVLLNSEHLTIIFDDQINNLSVREMGFLKMLGRKGVVTYDEITTLWGENAPTENAIRSFVRHLRKKIPQGLLENRSGIGYALSKK
jgi:DNA-binding response OmpR family regulator